MPAHTAACSPGAPREDSDRPPWAVADVLRHYGESSRAAYRVPPSHHKVRHDSLVCRTAALGGHAAQGPQWGCALRLELMPPSSLPQVSNQDQGAVDRRPPGRAPARAILPLRLDAPA
jgi:hypothetical protein